MQGYLKKQFKKNQVGTVDNNASGSIEYQMEELQGKLDAINNNLDETEHDETNTMENINDMLTREMDALRSLYGTSESSHSSPAEELKAPSKILVFTYVNN